MRLAASDTGPVLHLSEAQALDLLGLAAEVHIPPTVDVELTQHVPDWSARRPDWLVLDALVSPHLEDAAAWQQAGLLDGGEAEAIALARQINADWLLTDDAAARLFARAMNIEAHGSLGIVLWVAAAGQLVQSDAEAALERLAQSSLWISTHVLAEAGAALTQIFHQP
jgi:predicted nucleic acid-binding protein